MWLRHSYAESDLLTLAASAERYSEHPVTEEDFVEAKSFPELLSEEIEF